MARRRKGMSSGERLRMRERGANVRWGAKYMWWYVLVRPALVVSWLPVTAGVALVVAWVRVPHRTLGLATLIVAVGLGGGWVLYQRSDAALQHRQKTRAKGREPRGAGLGWAVGFVVAGLMGVSWFALGGRWS
jgi:hypothetical protein